MNLIFNGKRSRNIVIFDQNRPEDFCEPCHGSSVTQSNGHSGISLRILMKKERTFILGKIFVVIDIPKCDALEILDVCANCCFVSMPLTVPYLTITPLTVPHPYYPYPIFTKPQFFTLFQIESFYQYQ